MTSLLALHDLGAVGGGPWRTAFDTSWPGTVVAPDLPGHGDAAPPVGGCYELGDAVFAVADHLPEPDGVPPVVLGVGRNGFAAQILALAGRASALVLVDGLGGPWLDVPARNDALREARRTLLDTPAALEPHLPGTTDPRATLVLGPTDREHALRRCGALPVPTLVVETPDSPTPDAEVLTSTIPRGELVRVPSGAPAVVTGAVIEWWSALDG